MDAYSISGTCQGAMKVSSFAAIPPRLCLDMSFNRFPQGSFANDVDPLFAEPFLPSVKPASEDFTVAELAATLDAFKFPVRTDGVRGLLWGPFKDDPDTEEELEVPTLTVSEPNSRTDSSSSAVTADTKVILAAPAAWTKRQRIFPILRAPLIIRIKPTLKRRRQSEDGGDLCQWAAKVQRPVRWEDEDLMALAHVASIALKPASIPQPRSRITLCASSRLRYCC